MANAETHRLSMANTSDNNTKRRKNNAQNEIKYIHTQYPLETKKYFGRCPVRVIAYTSTASHAKKQQTDKLS